MTRIPLPLRRLVLERARGCCEYCLIHEDDGYFAHEPDHIISEKHGGSTTADNLALACFFCNRYKGSDIASLDPETGRLTPLFNPRTQLWSDHFALEGPVIRPLTPEGRVTVMILQLNHPDRLFERQVLISAARYPSYG
jgi:hypothetical protein